MNKAVVGHRSANEAVVLRGSKLARYRHDGSSVVVDWEVECRAKMIDCDLACTVVDAVVMLDKQYGIASWSWATGEPLFVHRIPDFSEPWALATSPNAEWAAIAPIEDQGWLVHRVQALRSPGGAWSEFRVRSRRASPALVEPRRAAD
jgi:hypothetical protein